MTSALLPSGCRSIRVISPKRWKTSRMSDLTVFGGRPVSVIDVVEEVSVSVFWSLEDSVSGMGVIHRTGRDLSSFPLTRDFGNC